MRIEVDNKIVLDTSEYGKENNLGKRCKEFYSGKYSEYNMNEQDGKLEPIY